MFPVSVIFHVLARCFVCTLRYAVSLVVFKVCLASLISCFVNFLCFYSFPFFISFLSLIALEGSFVQHPFPTKSESETVSSFLLPLLMRLSGRRSQTHHHLPNHRSFPRHQSGNTTRTNIEIFIFLVHAITQTTDIAQPLFLSLSLFLSGAGCSNTQPVLSQRSKVFHKSE